MKMTRGLRIAFIALSISIAGVLLGFLSGKSVLAVTKSRFEDLELFNKVLYLIENQYYRKVDTSKLIEGAINGMMETLDPHSSFLNKEFFKRVKNETDGEFGGLGIEVTEKDGYLYVITAIDDTPAFKAGLKSKDKIVEINHESIVGLPLNEAVKKMRGKIGAKIHLGISREGNKEILHFDIERKKIKVKSVKFELLAKNYAYIRLTQFQKRSSRSMVKALEKMQKIAKKNGGLKGIILDLRSNPGGLLDQAVEISSIFLEKGIVVSTEARDPNNKDIRYVKKSGFKILDVPMAVLINGSSASASEIVAGALQDHNRAVIMGSQSFGKGSVQSVAQIDKNNGVKLTIAQYMTPKGTKIQAIGVSPDVELNEYSAEMMEKYKYENTKYLRERDLRNHLTATIETPEEKSARVKQEAEERKIRAKKLKERKKKAASTDNIFKRFEAKEDYQVGQAINYLKSFKVFKSFINKKNSSDQ